MNGRIVCEKINVVEHDDCSVKGMKTVLVNPNSFFHAEPYVLHIPLENLHPRTPPDQRVRKVELVRMHFFQGAGFGEYDVYPEEAFRLFGCRI